MPLFGLEDIDYDGNMVKFYGFHRKRALSLARIHLQSKWILSQQGLMSNKHVLRNYLENISPLDDDNPSLLIEPKERYQHRLVKLSMVKLSMVKLWEKSLPWQSQYGYNVE